MTFLDQLKAFWTFISTPGTQMPASTTIITLAVIAAFTFLMPPFVQWLSYRRQNPMEDPKERARNAAQRTVNGSGAKKKNKGKKKKKH